MSSYLEQQLKDNVDGNDRAGLSALDLGNALLPVRASAPICDMEIKQFCLCERWRSLRGAKEERCWLQRRAHESSSARKRSPISMGVSVPYLQNKLIAVLRVGHRSFLKIQISGCRLCLAQPRIFENWFSHPG